MAGNELFGIWTSTGSQEADSRRCCVSVPANDPLLIGGRDCPIDLLFESLKLLGHGRLRMCVTIYKRISAKHCKTKEHICTDPFP